MRKTILVEWPGLFPRCTGSPCGVWGNPAGADYPLGTPANMWCASAVGSGIVCTSIPAPTEEADMDIFDLLASTPPQKKKHKIGEHGVSPQLTPDMKKCEEAHLTDVKNDDEESEEHGPVLLKGQRQKMRLRAGGIDHISRSV